MESLSASPGLGKTMPNTARYFRQEVRTARREPHEKTGRPRMPTVFLAGFSTTIMTGRDNPHGTTPSLADSPWLDRSNCAERVIEHILYFDLALFPSWQS